MKVYFVEYNYWGEYELAGVYKNEDRAKQVAKELNELNGCDGGHGKWAVYSHTVIMEKPIE